MAITKREAVEQAIREVCRGLSAWLKKCRLKREERLRKHFEEIAHIEMSIALMDAYLESPGRPEDLERYEELKALLESRATS